MLAMVRRLASVAPLGARGVAFAAVSSQSRARGLRKDPDSYLHSPSGVRYPGTAATLDPVRAFLGEFALPDKLALQCLVHKSFAHGKMPYNEKLAILGKELFRFEAFRSASEVPGIVPEGATVNAQNYNISHNAVELLSSTPVLAEVCNKAGLEPAMFYKPAGPKTGPTVKAKTIHALVGALALERGAPEAARFLRQRLMQGEYSVFEIADRHFVHN